MRGGTGGWLKPAPSERLISSLSHSQTRFSHQPVLMLLLQEDRQEVATQTGDCAKEDGWRELQAAASVWAPFPVLSRLEKRCSTRSWQSCGSNSTSHLPVTAEIRLAGRPVKKDSVVILQAVWWLATSPITIIITITITCGSRLLHRPRHRIMRHAGVYVCRLIVFLFSYFDGCKCHLALFLFFFLS